MMIAAIKLLKHFSPASHFLVLFLAFFFTIGLTADIGLAQKASGKKKKDSLNLPSKASVAKITKDFKACRKSVMSDLKMQKFPRKMLKEKLSTCQSTFAGGKLFLECKQNALKGSSKKGAQKSRAKLKECRSLLGQASYSPTNPLPFLIHKGNAYFAGLALNGKVQPFAERPNFVCDPMFRAFKEVDDPKFLFFGNAPKLFEEFDRNVFKAWKTNAEDPFAFTIDNVGKVYASEKQNLLYFPSGECFLEDRSSSIYKSLSIFYILDRPKETSLPYVGVAFYEDSYKSITIRDIVTKFQKQFGRKLAVTKKGLKTFISAKKITSFDEEGDPKDVCKGKGIGRYLVAISARQDSKRYPNYVMLSNIKQLCEHGETAVARMSPPN